MKVRAEGMGSTLYEDVAEEAIEKLRVPDDRRIPGVPQSIENIASQCALLRIFGNTFNTALLVRYHGQSNVAVVVTRESETPQSPYHFLTFLLWEKGGKVVLTDSVVTFLK